MLDDVADIDLIAVSDAAEALGVPITRIKHWIRDGVLVKGLSGVVTLLRDAGYADDDIVAWMFRADDSLPGTPIQALRENRGTEVKRRAQVAGY